MKYGRFNVLQDENGKFVCQQISTFTTNGNEVIHDAPTLWRGTLADTPEESKELLRKFIYPTDVKTIESFEL